MHFPGGNTSVMIAGNPAETRTENLPNIGLKRSHYSILLDSTPVMAGKRVRKKVAPVHQDTWRNGDTAPCILIFGTKPRWAASFTPLTLYPRGKRRRNPLEARWAPNPFWTCCQKSNPNSPVIQPSHASDWCNDRLRTGGQETRRSSLLQLTD
jgi:hypothetical protein